MASLVLRAKSGNCYNISLSWPPVLGDLAETMISGGITSKTVIMMLSAARQRKLFSLVSILRKYTLTTNLLQHVILDGREKLKRTS